jgi:hypothetical protein
MYSCSLSIPTIYMENTTCAVCPGNQVMSEGVCSGCKNKGLVCPHCGKCAACAKEGMKK